MLGIGCDLADVERIEKAIARKGFKERVFTPEEIAFCTGSHGDKVQSYAARFAAKEAFLRQTGTESDRLLRILRRETWREKDTPYIKSYRYNGNGSGSVGII